MIKKRIFSVILVACMLLLTIYVGKNPGADLVIDFGDENELVIWYTDETMANYISSASLDYGIKSGIKVTPVLVSVVDYLEQVNAASIQDDLQTPDLVVMTNDSLEKAYLAGLAVEIGDGGNWVNAENFGQSALQAVTYDNKYIAYPLYFETALLLYNQTYMEQMAKQSIENDINAENGEAAMALIEELENEEDAENLIVGEEDAIEVLATQIEETIDVMIPSTIDDIMNFADKYDAPEQVEAVFKWDVSDIFYNYFIVGNYMIVGGDTGEDADNIQIYNEETIACMKTYQSLNQFFSIEAKEVSYDSILKEFMEGKTVFAVVTTDAISKLEAAKKNGEFEYEYGLTTLPDVSNDLQSRTLSVTNAIAVNGYSENKAYANDFAKYLACDEAGNLYARTGKIAAGKNLSYKNDNIYRALEEYESSVPMPKMLEASNFWVQLEICFTSIWRGEDVNATLKKLSEQMKSQIMGVAYEETYIEDPILVSEEEIEETEE